jgi:hypothetical protein
MNTVIGVLLFAIFAFLSGLHFYWGVGGKWGKDATIPTNANNQKVLHPKLTACFVVGFGLLAIGLFILIKVNVIHFVLWNWLSNCGLRPASALFILRAVGEFKYVGFFKKVKHSTFAAKDTKYYSPLCLTLGVLMMVIALNK